MAQVIPDWATQSSEATQTTDAVPDWASPDTTAPQDQPNLFDRAAAWLTGKSTAQRDAQAESVIRGVEAKRAAEGPATPTSTDRATDWLAKAEEAKQAAVLNGAKAALRATGSIGATGPEDLQPSPADDFIAQNVAGLTSSESLAALPLFGMGAAPRLAMGMGALGSVPGDVMEGQYPQAALNALMGAGMIHGAPEARAETPSAAPERPATESEAPAAPEAAKVDQNAVNENNARFPRPVEPITARVPVPSWADEQAANLDAGQGGEVPVESPETATAVAAPPSVREPLTLDELRLMRERSDLQLQNDLAKRATGATHPAVDQRISAIDDELDTLANREAAPSQEAPPAPALDFAREQDTFRPEDEPRPTDEAVTSSAPRDEEVVQSSGQRQTAPQQSAGLGNRPQPQPGAASRATPGANVGVSHESLENAGLNPQRGAGRTWQQSVANGRKLLNEGADPALAARRLKGETSRSPVDDADVIRAQRERLASDIDRARAARNASPNDPELQRQYIQAQQAEIKFVKEAVKPLGTMWHQIGQGLQGEAPVSPGDFSGLAKLARDQKGAPLEPGEEFKLQKGVNDYTQSSKEVVDTAERVRQQVRRQSRGKTMSLDELKNDVAEWVKKATADCVT